MTAPRILIIEDDPAIRRGVVDALRFAGYQPLEAARGDDGLRLARTCQIDLLLLDLLLPGCEGMEILREVRGIRPTLPIIILTAKGDESDRVRGLSEGADDYVVKPFSVKEVLARIEAVLRRSAERPTDVAQLAIPGGRIDLARREVQFEDGSREEISQREAELLRYLAIHRGRAIARDEILANVWQISPRGLSTRTIDMHVVRLREKLRDSSECPEILVTVRGKGYMIGTSVTR